MTRSNSSLILENDSYSQNALHARKYAFILRTYRKCIRMTTNKFYSKQNIEKCMNLILTAANPGTDSFCKDQICKEHVNISRNIPVENFDISLSLLNK